MLTACTSGDGTGHGLDDVAADNAMDAIAPEGGLDVVLPDAFDAQDSSPTDAPTDRSMPDVLDAPDAPDAPDTPDALVCPAGMTACNDSCTDVSTDARNCGTCAHVCFGGTICSGGACACPAGQTLCSGLCVDVSRSDVHCGACGHACAANAMCVDGACATCSGSPSFATDVQPIFDASCARSTCHVPPSPSAGLDLTQGSAYAQLVGHAGTLCFGSARVAAGAASASEIVFALTGIPGASGCSPPAMPSGAPPLPDAQIDTIRAWICEGAPNN